MPISNLLVHMPNLKINLPGTGGMRNVSSSQAASLLSVFVLYLSLSFVHLIMDTETQMARSKGDHIVFVCPCGVVSKHGMQFASFEQCGVYSAIENYVGYGQQKELLCATEHDQSVGTTWVFAVDFINSGLCK